MNNHAISDWDTAHISLAQNSNLNTTTGPDSYNFSDSDYSDYLNSLAWVQAEDGDLEQSSRALITPVRHEATVCRPLYMERHENPRSRRPQPIQSHYPMEEQQQRLQRLSRGFQSTRKHYVVQGVRKDRSRSHEHAIVYTGEPSDSIIRIDQVERNHGVRNATGNRGAIAVSYVPQFGSRQRYLESDHSDPFEQMLRKRKYAELVKSFVDTHLKFTFSSPDSIQPMIDSATWTLLGDHALHYQDAWADGIQAMKRIIGGQLPSSKDFRGILGFTQVASAMRDVLRKADSPLASTEKFLNDLDRWRTLLEEDMLPAYDQTVRALWGKENRSATGWMHTVDQEQILKYFQDLVCQLLSTGSMLDLEHPNIDDPPTDHSATSGDRYVTRTPATTMPGSPSPQGIETSPSTATPTSQYVMMAAGAIFGLVMAFLLLCKHVILRLCFHTLTFRFLDVTMSLSICELGKLSMTNSDATLQFLESEFASLLRHGTFGSPRADAQIDALDGVESGAVDSMQAFEQVVLQEASVSILSPLLMSYHSCSNAPR